MDIILNRRSVRKFNLEKKLSYDQLYELCKYGEAAPKARNQESREYIIVDDTDVILKLSTISAGAKVLASCNTLIAVIGKNPNSLPTPRMQQQDLAAATQNILLAATSKNIGSCWIGVYPIEDRSQAANEILGLKDGAFVFSMIALGYPNNEDCFYELCRINEKMIHHNEY